MTPARALITRLTSAGVTLRLDGDAIVHRGPRSVLSPDVLAKLRHYKAEIVAELRGQGKIGSPCLADIVEGNGCEREKVDPGVASPNSWHAEALRCRIVAVLDRLPAPRDHSGRRLIAETRKFLESRWWTEAIECGWAPEELFGLDGSAPLDNHERWGMIVGLALAPRPGDAIEHLDAEHAVIRHAPSPKMKNTRRVERRFRPTATTVVWWRCSTLMGDVERLTVWNS